MNADGVPRKLARKVIWAVAMSTAACGIEALWEGQSWLLDGFDKLSAAIGRAVAVPSAQPRESTPADIRPTQPQKRTTPGCVPGSPGRLTQTRPTSELPRRTILELKADVKAHRYVHC